MFVNKTRRKTMTYNKPEVLKLDSALKAIQAGGPKPSGPVEDSIDPFLAPTNGAYEADE